METKFEKLERKVNSFLDKHYESIEYAKDFFGLRSTISFTWKTRIRPLLVTHHYCTYIDSLTHEETKGWYINDSQGNMIPWVHKVDSTAIQCMYFHDIKTLDKED